MSLVEDENELMKDSFVKRLEVLETQTLGECRGLMPPLIGHRMCIYACVYVIFHSSCNSLPAEGLTFTKAIAANQVQPLDDAAAVDNTRSTTTALYGAQPRLVASLE